MNKLTVCQPVWYVNLLYRDHGLKESTISSIGRKYFTVEKIGGFFKDTLQHDGRAYVVQKLKELTK